MTGSLTLVMLDTNILSELRLPSPDPNVAAWFASLDARDVATSATSIAEIEYGIACLPATHSARAPLLRWLEAILTTQLVLPLDVIAGRILGRMWGTRELRNAFLAQHGSAQPRFGGDLMIAATAIAHGARVATRNIGDFVLIARHFPALRVLDPFTGKTV